MTGTAGADWKGGGEIKALRRIVGGSAEEDEDAPAPVGHNHAPAGAVHEATGADIALEEQAQVVERILTEERTTTERVGRELIKLRTRFCAVEIGRRERILRLRAEGVTHRTIGATLGISHSSVGNHIRDAAKGRESQLDTYTKGCFLTWAMTRFRFKRSTLKAYMNLGGHPEKVIIRTNRDKEKQKANRLLAALMRATLKEKVAPPVFKSAFLALGDQNAAARTAIACWIISLEAGSDDPQEIARWFAAHRLR